jgi:hypothetical protein
MRQDGRLDFYAEPIEILQGSVELIAKARRITEVSFDEPEIIRPSIAVPKGFEAHRRIELDADESVIGESVAGELEGTDPVPAVAEIYFPQRIKCNVRVNRRRRGSPGDEVHHDSLDRQEAT